MGKLPIALQLYTVRDEWEADFEGTLQKISEMGYDGVEFAGLPDMDTDSIRNIVQKCDLQPISAHVSFRELADDTEATVSKYKTIGCTYIAIPSLSEEKRPGGAEFPQTLKDIARIGECCNQKDITLLYHNHDYEFVTMPDGEFGLDAIFQDVSADLLQTELDVCWVRVAKQSPVDYIHKYANRCPVVHLKDFYAKGGEGREDFEYRPVGMGVVDMPGVLDAALQCGANWVVVEQDEPGERSRMEAAQLSMDFLKKMGW